MDDSQFEENPGLYAYWFLTEVMGPTAIFATIVNAFAVVSNYWYPQQRKFPNIVLVWSW